MFTFVEQKVWGRTIVSTGLPYKAWETFEEAVEAAKKFTTETGRSTDVLEVRASVERMAPPVVVTRK